MVARSSIKTEVVVKAKTCHEPQFQNKSSWPFFPHYVGFLCHIISEAHLCQRISQSFLNELLGTLHHHSIFSVCTFFSLCLGPLLPRLAHVFEGTGSSRYQSPIISNSFVAPVLLLFCNLYWESFSCHSLIDFENEARAFSSVAVKIKAHQKTLF